MPRFVLLVLLLLASLEGWAAVKPLPAPRPLDAPPAQATGTATGMAYQVLTPGPDPSNLVREPFIEYRLDGWSADGVTRFNAAESGSTVSPLRELVRFQPGLARALLTTPVGETRRWWLTAEVLAPGYPGMPALPHVMDVTVLGGSDPTRAPPDVAVVPADAQRTPSGLAYKVLARGKGGATPAPGDIVLVHYTGWTPDGRVFDSSLRRNVRSSLPLDQVISGWREGMGMMARGDRFRFWIPGELAYDAVPMQGAPRGMLVFDVTLYGFARPGQAQAHGGNIMAADPQALPEG
ncbi:FKBP-type peptidyl-prolyl cis-trans isomerase [Arenimonas sp.]|uniref:FKBP-type peptidyl-prolyl cis-trans isomerase n=1 Tax=Arenimonas sp. TaxID=1872635 RepID=UPI0035B35F2A